MVDDQSEKNDMQEAAATAQDKASNANNEINEIQQIMQPENEEKKKSLEEIIRLEDELSLTKNQLLRMKAEIENIRKRNSKEVEETNKYAVSKFVRDLVEAVENLYRAINSIENNNEDKIAKTVYEGLIMTKDAIEKVFSSYHIKRIYPIGEAFDHHLHQAVTHIAVQDQTPGSVIDVIQSGYVLKDRLIRPALVAVAKQEEQEEQE